MTEETKGPLRSMSADSRATSIHPSELACDRCGRTIYYCRCGQR